MQNLKNVILKFKLTIKRGSEKCSVSLENFYLSQINTFEMRIRRAVDH